MKIIVPVLILCTLSVAVYAMYVVFSVPEDGGVTYTDLNITPIPQDHVIAQNDDLSRSLNLELVDVDGKIVTTRNFTSDPAVVLDIANNGRYVLAGDIGYCDSDQCAPVGGVSDFSISFDLGNQYFHVALMNEPIHDVRREAEQFMLDRLGVREEELCRLRATVMTPSFVNEFFAGQQLGFSFCPNSVTLQ